MLRSIDNNDGGVRPDVVAISNPDVAQVIVHFVRQSGSYITSCFIPTAMLGLLAYSTFFIHIDDFNDRWTKVAKCVVDDVGDGGHKHTYIEVKTFSSS